MVAQMSLLTLDKHRDTAYFGAEISRDPCARERSSPSSISIVCHVHNLHEIFQDLVIRQKFFLAEDRVSWIKFSLTNTNARENPNRQAAIRTIATTAYTTLTRHMDSASQISLSTMTPHIGHLLHLMGYLLNWTSVAAFTSACVYLYFRNKFSFWTRRGLKNPMPIPWFGTTLYPLFTPKPELELKLHQSLGKLYGLYDGFLGTNPTLVCGHPEAIKQVTIKHFDLFTNRRKPATWKSIRYRALTYLRDDEWKNLRNTLAPVFTSSKLKRMFELMKRCTRNLQNSIEKQSEFEIDLKQLFSVFTVDVISTCCFSMDLKDYLHPNSEILTSARKFFNVSRLKMAFYMAIPKQLLAVSGFDINDTLSIDFFARFATEIINKRRELKAQKSIHYKKQDDFLQTLIDAAAEFNERKARATKMTTTTNQQDVDSKNLMKRADEQEALNNNTTDNNSHLEFKQVSIRYTEQQLGDLEILAQSMLFFAVGHETTATLLASCGFFLALHPDLQDRLYNEVHEAFVADNDDITYERLLELKYLDAFISEALRYYTPTLVFDREASEDVEIEVDGLKLVIPKGMGVVIPFHAIHHDPDNYEDPERFDPERFMPENKHKIKSSTFIPFGSGPRYCLASRFALMEAKLALASLVNKFRFIKSEGTTWPPKFRHHYMLLQMEWPKIKFVDRKLADLHGTVNSQAQVAA